MKYVTCLLLLIMLCFAGTSDAGYIGTSHYEEVWDITITDCSGKTTVYKNSAITEMNEQWLVFIPDGGRNPSSNMKRKTVPVNSDCLTVVMDEQ